MYNKKKHEQFSHMKIIHPLIILCKRKKHLEVIKKFNDQVELLHLYPFL